MSVPGVHRFMLDMQEPRDEDLIPIGSVKELCGNDTVKIKMVTKDGQAVSWKDVIDKKYLSSDLITVMTNQDGTVEIYTDNVRVF
jgi:hypothetical protein